MAITSIEIENFKGIGPRQVIPIAPITLLFGANSAGKSTILHAMEHTRQLLVYSTGRSDTSTEKPLDASSLEVGSFASLVHKNDVSRRVRLKFTMAVDDLEYDYFPENRNFDGARELLSDWAASRSEYERIYLSYLLGGEHSRFLESRGLPSTIVTRLKSCAVELEIASRPGERTPIITRYSVDIDGRPFAAMEVFHYVFDSHNQSNSKLVSLTPTQPVFRDFRTNAADQDQGGLTYFEKCVKQVYQRIERFDYPHQDDDRVGGKESLYAELPAESNDDVSSRLGFSLTLVGQRHALPDLDGRLQFFELSTHVARPQESDPAVSSFWPFAQQAQLNKLLDELILGPARLLKQMLSELIHIGPLRELPHAEFIPLQLPDRARWRTGLAAWDLLYKAPRYAGDDLLAQTNTWLAGPKGLDIGCTIEAVRVVEVEDDTEFVRLLTSPAASAKLTSIADEFRGLPYRTRLHLRDTRNGAKIKVSSSGVGVAQVVPIIVAMRMSDSPSLFLEQPELHLHPSAQVRLGDLIASVGWRAFQNCRGPWSNEPQQFDRRHDHRVVITETHSEHLLLRLLRRIRETSAGEVLPEHVGSLTRHEVAVIFVESSPDGSRYTHLRVNDDGEFEDRWPQGFFEERIREMF